MTSIGGGSRSEAVNDSPDKRLEFRLQRREIPARSHDAAGERRRQARPDRRHARREIGADDQMLWVRRF